MQTLDKEQATRFLATLAGDSRLTFQTFDDSEAKRRELSRILHGSLESHFAKLAELNAAGSGVFVMVAEGNGKGRKGEHVTRLRALFVDLDGSPVGPVLTAPLAPSIVVESSSGKWHAYWLCDDIPPDQFKNAQKVLAARYDADPKVCDLPRVMRVPGFAHRKADPFVSRIDRCNGQWFTWSELVEAFGLSSRMTLPGAIAEGQRNDKLFKLAKSAAAKGTPEAEQLKKALLVNTRVCKPPLAHSEVEQIVASAYRAPLQGMVPMPLAVVDCDAYLALDDAARTLLMLAYRKADGFNGGRIALTWSECRPWFPRKDTFNAVRKRLVKSGLIEVASDPVKPSKGRRPKAGMYRVAIGPFGVAYDPSRIGPFGVAPEALQVGGCGDVGGEGRRRSNSNAHETHAEPSGFSS